MLISYTELKVWYSSLVFCFVTPKKIEKYIITVLVGFYSIFVGIPIVIVYVYILSDI